jgi:hypothetical protein
MTKTLAILTIHDAFITRTRRKEARAPARPDAAQESHRTRRYMVRKRLGLRVCGQIRSAPRAKPTPGSSCCTALIARYRYGSGRDTAGTGDWVRQWVRSAKIEGALWDSTMRSVCKLYSSHMLSQSHLIRSERLALGHYRSNAAISQAVSSKIATSFCSSPRRSLGDAVS